jgi:hypothetical protein
MAAYFVVNDTTLFSGPELHHSTGRHLCQSADGSVHTYRSDINPSHFGRGLTSKADRRAKVRSLGALVTAHATHVPLAVLVVLGSPPVPTETTPEWLASHRASLLA